VIRSETASFDRSVLDLDLEAEADRIAAGLRQTTAHVLHRRGLVVAISGGIDSSCCAALSVRALGAGRVLGLVLPERDSSDDSAARAHALASHLGIDVIETDIAPALEAIGCYAARDAAVRAALPEYTDGCQDDPAKVACDYPETPLQKVVSTKWLDAGGPAVDLAKKFTFTNDDQNAVAKYISEDKMSPEDAAAKWVADNADKVAEWTS
jgi:NH3-dependent NAD+ synthetase